MIVRLLLNQGKPRLTNNKNSNIDLPISKWVSNSKQKLVAGWGRKTNIV